MHRATDISIIYYLQSLEIKSSALQLMLEFLLLENSLLCHWYSAWNQILRLHVAAKRLKCPKHDHARMRLA
jgi:hypothetical protein